MKRVFLIAFLILFLFGAVARANIFDTTVVDIQSQSKVATDGGKILVVLMTMPDCPNCEYMEKNVFSNKAFEKQFNLKFFSSRLDITSNSSLIDSYGKETTPNELAKRLRVYGSPAFVFYDQKGGVIYRYTGKLDLAGFKKLITYVLAGQYERKPFQVSSIKAINTESVIPDDVCSTQKSKLIH